MKNSSSHSSTILSNRISSTDQEQSKPNPTSRGKPEWQKNTLRVCGNWSEQLSSKGKVYFYNCITEKSQWQKPNEWTLPDIPQNELDKIICDRQGDVGLKRTFATLSESDKSKSRSQDGSSSPKRVKYSANKDGARHRSDSTTFIKSEPLPHRDSKKFESGSGDPNELRPSSDVINYSDVSTTSSVANPSNYSNSVRESQRHCDNVKPDDKSVFGKVSFDKINAVTVGSSAVNVELNRTCSPSVKNCSSHLTGGDQCSRSSSPEEDSLQRKLHHRSTSEYLEKADSSTTSNGEPLCSNSQHKDCSNFEGNSRSDKQSSSPNKTSAIKPDQVLRNLFSVLMQNQISNSKNANRTSPLNSTPNPKPLVATFLSTFLGSQKKSLSSREASRVASPSSNNRTRNERTPSNVSSDGPAASSPALRASCSPALPSSASLHSNPTQNRHSPLSSRSVSQEATLSSHQHRRNHSEEDGDASHRVSNLSSDVKQSSITLDSSDMLRFVDSHISSRFQHSMADLLGAEAKNYSHNFNRLHGVLFSELSAELKKLRALVFISETKLKVHQTRKMALEDLVSRIEERKPPPSLLSSQDAPP